MRFRYLLEGQDHDWKKVLNDRQMQIRTCHRAPTASASSRATTAPSGTGPAPRWSSRLRRRFTRPAGSGGDGVGVRRAPVGGVSIARRATGASDSIGQWSARSERTASRGSCTTAAAKLPRSAAAIPERLYLCRIARQTRNSDWLVRLIKRRRLWRKGAMPCRDYGPPPSKRTTSLWRSARSEQNSRPTAVASDRYSTWLSKARREAPSDSS